MKNKILGVIGILWGGAILARGFFVQSPAGSEAYQSGQITALIFGAIMCAAGFYYFFKKNK